MSSTYFTEQKASDYPPSDAVLPVFGFFPEAPPPKTPLAEYRVLSPTASVRVSPLCLGAMNLGNQWAGLGSEMSTADAFAFLDAFYDAGGNFIDTANSYQAEQSERLIGEWMQARQNRDSIVLATKFSWFYHYRMDRVDPGVNVNFQGNSAKSLHVSFEASLRKLQTDYVDILYVHYWDWSASIPELMGALNDLVRQRRVLYLGASDMPAWVVAACNEYAKARGMAQFVVFQGRFSLADRAVEEEVIPMLRHQRMALAPFGVLGSGKFKSPEALREQEVRGTKATDAEIRLAEVLQGVADELSTSDMEVTVPGVALAWSRQKYEHSIPLIGGHKIEHLKSNIEMLRIKLTPEQMATIDKASPHHHMWPQTVIGGDPRGLGGKSDMAMSSLGGHWSL